MSSKTLDTLDLRLYGEHINLNIRGDDEARKGGPFPNNRPRSALYSSNLNTPDSKRRPFSAGNHPNSLSIQPFLKKVQADRRDLSLKPTDCLNRSISIPGATDSTILFNKLVKDPVGSTSQLHQKHRNIKSCLDFSTRNFMNFDNKSDVSSVDTVTSFGTKIKNKAQINKKAIEDKLGVDKVEGSPLKLIKSKTVRRYADLDSSVDYTAKSRIDLGDVAERNNNIKLSIYVPNGNKDENTSSGVSSSSDIQALSTNSPVHEARTSGHKFSRPKRNIPINWFPDSTSSDQDKSEIFGGRDNADVKGVVSFGKEFERYEEEEDDDCPPESPRLFNTELSLVEEESSQESDGSLKISTSHLEHYTDRETKSPRSNLVKISEIKEVPPPRNDVSVSYCREPKYEFKPNEENKPLNFYENSGNISLSNFVGLGENNEVDMERRFIDLKNKYKVDLGQLNDTQLKSLEMNTGLDSNIGLKRDWTSLENVVSKENDPICLTGGGNRDKQHGGYSMQRALTESYFDYKSSSFDEDTKRDGIFSSTLHEIYIGDKKTDHWSKEDTVKQLKDIPDVIINHSKILESYNAPTVYEEKTVEASQSQSKADGTEKDEIKYTTKVSEEYPDYLKSTEVKQYTSKVIEDYKKEIATIDSEHKLALKGIRDSDKDRFDIKNYGRLYVPDPNDPPPPDPNDTLNKDISNFIREYKSYKLGNSKSSPRIGSGNVDSDVEEADDKTTYVEATKSKLKKKTKKKERAIATKLKSCSGNESGDSGLKKKPKMEAKRLSKSSLSKREGNNKVRFKPHKIFLSKSSTNKSITADKESEIISWMANKVPAFDEISSIDVNETPTPDLIKEKTLYFPSDTYSPTNDTSKHEAEKQIEPVIRDTPVGLHDYMATNDTARDVLKDKNKHKEVTFEVDTRTPSGDEEFSLRDWVGNDADGNELSDLLDDTTMVSNIYSVLKEIEQTGSTVTDGSGDKVMPITSADRTIDDSKSVEYRDILSYLEKVESTANEDISTLSHTTPPFSLKVEELMELSKGELAHRAVAGALAAGKAGAAAARLRAALVSAANKAGTRIKAERLAARQKANAAAQQSAQTVSRHQKFIEQLINEKKGLTGRIEKLVAAVEAAEARSARAARASADRLQLELKNQRQRLNQAHHRDKQTWLKQHTQKIKDMTIKGLEGEIKELEDKHTSRMLAVQKECEDKILEEKAKHIKEMRLLKESTTRHLEDELDRERLIAAERLEQKRVEWESALITATERAGADGREAAREARKEVELWMKDKEKELEERRRQIEEQAEERRNALLAEASQMKETLMKEFEKYKEEYRKKQTNVLKDKELEIRSITRRERDREIERAIESMEAEAEEGRKEMQEAIRKIKAKYEDDMKILEDAEQSALQRCKEVRELLRESQESCAQHQVTITQLEGRLRQADELRAQSISEMEISMRTLEMKHKEAIEEMRAQILNLQLQHKDEMHQLYAKVKVAVAKKDDSLTAARREAATLRDRCLRLEARLAT